MRYSIEEKFEDLHRLELFSILFCASSCLELATGSTVIRMALRTNTVQSVTYMQLQGKGKIVPLNAEVQLHSFFTSAVDGSE
jgi:hypothetical protein